MDVPDWPAHLPALVDAAPLPGGLICTVLGGTLADGRAVVVKRCPYPAEVEADGLAALAAARAPVPAVLAAVGDLLVLERVAGPPDWAGLGRAVARLHRTTGPRFGWHRDNSGGRILAQLPQGVQHRRVDLDPAAAHVPGPVLPGQSSHLWILALLRCGVDSQDMRRPRGAALRGQPPRIALADLRPPGGTRSRHGAQYEPGGSNGGRLPGAGRHPRELGDAVRERTR